MNRDLMKITELTKKTGISSRTLRYYEQVGLIKSIRPQFEAYRYYDEETIERLEQIIILRKMQIPVKDIIRIYESDDISETVEVFCQKIHEINREITALSELKNIINTFLQKMIESGIQSITAVPLLYEEIENQFKLMAEKEKVSEVSYEALDTISRKLEAPLDISIQFLPQMRVISSYLKDRPGVTDSHGFQRFVQLSGLVPGQPGSHERFEFQTEGGEVSVFRIKEDYENRSEYQDYIFPGGLFAALNVYADEDLPQRLQSLVLSFDENRFYQIDYQSDGQLRHPALIEDLISPDEKRDLLCLYVPVKKRTANPGLFDAPKELSSDSVSVGELEAMHPVLWKKDLPLEQLTPVNGAHYRVLENGEAAYVGWISTRVLNTHVAVKLPYRVDIEFKVETGSGFDFGTDEGSLIFYRGDDGVYMSTSGEYFGVNTDNHASDSAVDNDPARREAIQFRQPVFLDWFDFPGRGKIKYNEYNRLTWIVGDKVLAVILNGEIRYCGREFPYMSLDLSRDVPKNIYIGSNGQWMKYFRSVSVTQLEYRPKNKLKEGDLSMIVRQSNNLISNIHRLITDEYGENFWLNGGARYVMECLGEKDFDYSFFAGLSGDSFALCYPKHGYMGDALSAAMLSLEYDLYLKEKEDGFTLCKGESGYVERLFEKCGYSSTFVSNKSLKKNTEMYLNTLISYIDKGVPVIFWGTADMTIGVFVGYEEYGKNLLYITGNSDTPQNISLEKALEVPGEEWSEKFGWIFVGEKKDDRSLAEIYRKAVFSLPGLLQTETDEFSLGAKAFRAWADEIESGKFDAVKPEEFDQWMAYSTYICMAATIGSCCHGFLDKALQLNPDLEFLKEVSRLYHDYEDLWHRTEGNLESLGGGFNVTLAALQDKERRSKIAAKLRDFAGVTDEIINVINAGIKNLSL